MTIQWTETETRTELRKFRLLRQELERATFTWTEATDADLIVALQENHALRHAVAMWLNGGPVADWQARAEFAEDSLDAARKNGAVLASDRDAWKSRAETAERERDEARAERDAAGRARHVAYVERDRADERLRILERELAEARARLAQVDMFGHTERLAADALELRARRALDGWVKSGKLRRVSYHDDGILASQWKSPEMHTMSEADTPIDLCRRLGLLGDEGAGT